LHNDYARLCIIPGARPVHITHAAGQRAQESRPNKSPIVFFGRKSFLPS
jgi:hypothetical protein